VLKVILSRWGGPWGEGTAMPPGLNFGEPIIDFVKMANSMGVAAERVSTSSELRGAIERGLGAGAPYLLDIRLEQPHRVPWMPAVVPPLTGIRVLDLSQALSGPYATMMLADAGADVIKLEPPDGDHVRSWLQGEAGVSPYLIAANRSKRS